MPLSKTRSKLFYLRFFVMPFALSLGDMFVTLFYQSPAYWAGDRSAVIEGNPAVWLALRIHPILILPGLLAWYVIVCFLLFKTPAWIGLRLQVFLVLAHLVAIGGWLIRFEEQGIWMISGLAAVALISNGLLIAPYLKHWNSKSRLVPEEGR